MEKGEKGSGLVYAAKHYLPLIMTFNVQTPPPTPSTRSVAAMLPHFALYQIHGYTTGTDVAKRRTGQPHPLPVDRQVQKGGGGVGNWSMPLYITYQ